MRDVEVLFDSDSYLPGDTVTATVRVTTDKAFKCNRIVARVLGEVYVTVVRGAGKHRHTYREHLEILREHVVLSEATNINPGTYDYPFTFTIPQTAPCSYYRYRAEVTYTVNATVEVSWAIDPKAEALFYVRPTYPVLTPRSQVLPLTLDDRRTVIEINLPSDVLSPNAPLVIRHMIKMGEPKLRALRFELYLKEDRVARGKSDTRTILLDKKEVPAEDLSYTTWREVYLQPEPRTVVELKTPILSVSYFLKVTADIPWRFDETLEVPLRAGIVEQQADAEF